jgi:pseudaminic acid cytidylyltransferase
MNSLCIIPARGGSKRIPRKNIKYFLGKPIIAYSIEAALKSNLFDEVIVSTDDKEIAEIAIKYGANVPFLRSEKNSDDFATTHDVLNEVLNRYSEESNQFAVVCCLYPCAPFVTYEKLIEAYEILIKNKANSVFPVIEYSYPIQRSIKLDGTVSQYNYNEFKDFRSQDLEKTYHDSGQFYFMKSSIVLNDEEFVGNNSHAIVISELEAQDIDTETDWKFAEIKYQLLKL